MDALLAGISPRRATYFLRRSQKKVGKEKAAPLAVSPSGQPAMLGRGAALPNSLRSLRSLRSDSGSESEHDARMLRCAPAPRPVLLGTARRGVKSIRAIASLGPRLGGAAASRGEVLLPLPLGEGWGEGNPSDQIHRGPLSSPPSPQRGKEPYRGRAQRWPEQRFNPLWMRRGAQRAGCANAAQHAFAWCSDSLPLSERRERSQQSEFGSGTPPASTAGCPQRSGGTQPVGPPFFCLLFFGGAKKSRCAAGRTSRPTAHPIRLKPASKT